MKFSPAILAALLVFFCGSARAALPAGWGDVDVDNARWACGVAQVSTNASTNACVQHGFSVMFDGDGGNILMKLSKSLSEKGAPEPLVIQRLVNTKARLSLNPS